MLAFTGCTQKKATPNVVNYQQTDSLQKIIAQRDNEINDMMGTLNEIQEGFREITEAENRVNIAKDGEGTNKTQQIKENIQFISNTMKRNRETKKVVLKVFESELNLHVCFLWARQGRIPWAYCYCIRWKKYILI
jgi:hypothetical protein